MEISREDRCYQGVHADMGPVSSRRSKANKKERTRSPSMLYDTWLRAHSHGVSGTNAYCHLH